MSDSWVHPGYVVDGYYVNKSHLYRRTELVYRHIQDGSLWIIEAGSIPRRFFAEGWVKIGPEIISDGRWQL